MLLLFARHCSAKVLDGQVRLSSQATEIYLAKFSFSPRVEGTINMTFHVDGTADYFDRHQHLLTLCLYSDVDWPKFRKALDKGSLCVERQKLATWSAKVCLKYSRALPCPRPARPRILASRLQP